MASGQAVEQKMSEFGFPLPTGDPSVLPAGAKLERVFDAACFLTHGISVRPDDGPNDLTIDEKGRIYFTDPRYFGYEAIEQPILGVYRIDPDGKVTRIITDAGKPNGICVSPDQKTLYVIANDNGSLDQYRMQKGETSQRALTALLAYALAPDGTVSNRRVLIDWFPNDGGDGMTVDVDGNLYVP